jgi:hypothetical protein
MKVTLMMKPDLFSLQVKPLIGYNPIEKYTRVIYTYCLILLPFLFSLMKEEVVPQALGVA